MILMNLVMEDVVKITRQEKYMALLMWLKEAVRKSPNRRKSIFDDALALLVCEGLLYEAKYVARLLWRELKIGELETIVGVCDEEGRHDEADDAREMLPLNAKEKVVRLSLKCG